MVFLRKMWNDICSRRIIESFSGRNGNFQMVWHCKSHSFTCQFPTASSQACSQLLTWIISVHTKFLQKNPADVFAQIFLFAEGLACAAVGITEKYLQTKGHNPLLEAKQTLIPVYKWRNRICVHRLCKTQYALINQFALAICRHTWSQTPCRRKNNGSRRWSSGFARCYS